MVEPGIGERHGAQRSAEATVPRPSEVRYDGQTVQVAYDMKTWIAAALCLLFVPVSTLAVPYDGGSLTAYVGATLIQGGQGRSRA